MTLNSSAAGPQAKVTFEEYYKDFLLIPHFSLIIRHNLIVWVTFCFGLGYQVDAQHAKSV